MNVGMSSHIQQYLCATKLRPWGEGHVLTFAIATESLSVCALDAATLFASVVAANASVTRAASALATLPASVCAEETATDAARTMLAAASLSRASSAVASAGGYSQVGANSSELRHRASEGGGRRDGHTLRERGCSRGVRGSRRLEEEAVRGQISDGGRVVIMWVAGTGARMTAPHCVRTTTSLTFAVATESRSVVALNSATFSARDDAAALSESRCSSALASATVVEAKWERMVVSSAMLRARADALDAATTSARDVAAEASVSRVAWGKGEEIRKSVQLSVIQATRTPTKRCAHTNLCCGDGVT